jgi:predicted ATPase
MITKWKLFNFKSIRNETELEFGPLTILAGSNSSGKSTVLQSMLLISQTLSSRISSRSVILNGSLAKLGQFDDIKSFGSEARQILIGWECQPRPASQPIQSRMPLSNIPYELSASIQKVDAEVSFEVDPSSSQRDLLQLQPRLFGFSMDSVVRDNKVDEQSRIDVRSAQDLTDISPKIQGAETSKIEDEALRATLDYDIELDNKSLRELQRRFPGAETIGCSLQHFLPYRLSIRYSEIDYIIYRIIRGILPRLIFFLTRDQPRRRKVTNLYLRDFLRHFAIDTDAEIKVPESVFKIIQEFFEENVDKLELTPTQSERDQEEAVIHLFRTELKPQLENLIRQEMLTQQPSEYRVVYSQLPENITSSIKYTESLFTRSMKYLGPLRDEPKPLYPLATLVDPKDIGLRGEYTSAVYDLHQHDLVRFVPTANFIASAVKLEQSTRSMETAVQDWLTYMGVAESVQTIDKGKLGHELKVTTSASDAPQDLTHVGVGVSQVLPILVMCLLANPDTTLIIEQPELHLHPKVQTLLADFFLSMAMLGKQCIIETHSEYIINRLRFRAAAAQDETMSSLMKMYFVQKKEGASVFDPVIVNKYGAITDWPEGFFDQSQSEAEEILRAATIKRKKEKGGK